MTSAVGPAWGRPRASVWLALGFAWGASACGESDGRFSVRFRWPDGPPARPSRWEVEGEVRSARGQITRSQPRWVTLSRSTRLAFPAVPYGPDLVVEVRVRSRDEPDAGVRYFGRSEPFDFQPGEVTVVPVAVALTDGPALVEGAGQPAVRVLEARAGRVRHSEITLAVRARGAAQIDVAQDVLFRTGLHRTFTATAAVSTHRVPYDLARGIDGCTPDPGSCDGLRSLFVRVARAGLESAPATVQVVLDTSAPEAFDLEFGPATAKLGDVATLSFTATEPLADTTASSVLEWEGEDPGFSFFRSDGSRHTYRRLIDAPSLPEQVRFRLAALHLTDEAGNSRRQPLDAGEGLFSIDAEVPAIRDLQIEPRSGRVGPGARVVLSFSVSEPVGNRVEATLDGTSMPCTEHDGAYRCVSAPFEPDAPSERTAEVLLEVEDAAGNAALASRAVVLDAKPPELLRVDRRYVTSPSNPAVRVDAATEDTEVFFSVAFSEALPEDTGLRQVSIPNSARQVPVERLDQTERSAELVLQVACNALFDGPGNLRLDLEDVAGNRTTVTATGAFQVDCTPDSLRVAQDRVSFFRAPVKNAGAELLVDGSGAPGHTRPAGPELYALGPADPDDPAPSLPAATFRFAGGSAPRRIRFWADPDRTERLGEATPDSGGRWPRSDLRLSPIDAPGVWVTGLDGAGNESEPVRIRSTWYVAASGPGSGATPHRASRWGRRTAPSAPRAPVADRTPLAAPDGVALVQRGERTWLDRTPRAPSPRNESAMVWEAGRGRVLLFGGDTRGGLMDDTWEWDGHAWRPVLLPAGAPRPRPRMGHDMAYDAARGRVVLFGGYGLSDTWEWDGSNWKRIVRPAGAHGPDARGGHALAYDAARRRVVLFGGARGVASVRGDTWTWDGATWTRETAPGPPARAFHSMAWDAARERVVLFGGLGGSGLRDDTWEWDGTTWSDVTPVEPGPPGRADHVLVPDPVRRRVVLLSGPQDDVWEWDGARWTEVSFSSPGPGGRTLPAGAFDGRGVLLFGGRDGSWTLRGDSWRWSGSGFARAAPTAGEPNPPPRSGAALAHGDGQTLLFGGFGGEDSASAISDLWSFDGVTWTQLSVPGGPPPMVGHAMVWVEGRDRWVLYDGGSGASRVWEFDGHSWTEVTPDAGPAPAARVWPAAASASGEMLLFGGLDAGGATFADLWAWTGQAWVQRACCPGPAARGRAAMVHDAGRNRTVLFGGEVRPLMPRADTWEWDGALWRGPQGGSPPPARDSHALIFDETRQTVLLFGGFDSAALPLADLWEWNGSAWNDVTPPAGALAPSPRWEHAMTFDPGTGRGISFGGDGDETWLLEAPGRPTVQFAAQLPGDMAPDQVTGMKVRAFCGGWHGPKATGAELMAWAAGSSAGTWRRLDQHGQDVPDGGTAPVPLTWTASSPARARSLWGPADQVVVQCRALGNGGASSELARVGADYFEVRVRYDAP